MLIDYDISILSRKFFFNIDIDNYRYYREKVIFKKNKILLIKYRKARGRHQIRFQFDKRNKNDYNLNLTVYEL